ncbi:MULTISPECIES: hypothetical protein [Vibrio]|uniref:hypothetical protein n=1 Tax=Vibrio TaxID=662 RepID=UPI00102A2589|nr:MULTISPECIES: hypothetical protein [Vibrio]EGR0111356.1 hypothetical protein [Vibrio vulnificus]EIF5019790.1 hypothetical protein [Vibrio vulnificus]EIO2325387.1 hypothetical protein [Vibrio vulnificus]EIO4070196.1 hypothetical protein [Vibrio vulnificus]ELH0905530.1 hypothetical protein [Vibrio vulnificus]
MNTKKMKTIGRDVLSSLAEAVGLVVIMIGMTSLITFLLERFEWKDFTIQSMIKENVAYVSILISAVTLALVNVVYILIPRYEESVWVALNKLIKAIAVMLRGYILCVLSFIISGYFNDIDVVITFSFWLIFLLALAINPLFEHIEYSWHNMDKAFLAIVCVLYMFGIVMFAELPKYS